MHFSNNYGALINWPITAHLRKAAELMALCLFYFFDQTIVQ